MRKLKLLLTMLVLLVGGGLSANAETDYTSSITNPNFSTNADGWTITGNAKHFNGTGFDGDKFMELTNWGSSWDATISQTVTELPNGYYKVKAAGQMTGASDCWMKLVANGAENYFSRNGDTNGNILADGTETTIGGDGAQAGWRYSSVIAKVTDGTLVISCVGHSDVKERWANFDHVTLTYLGESIAAGTDVSDFINNWDFWGCYHGAFNGWTISAPNGGNTWENGNSNVEYWIGSATNGQFDYYQELIGLPAGKYTISASMWNSTNGEDPAPAGVNEQCGVYGTSSNATVFKGVNTDGDALNTYTTDAIVVSDGALRIGVKNNTTMGARWFGVDWIKLTYQDPFISAIATEIPAATATALTAGKWYKFTAASTGDHSFDATAIANISCTSTDQLLSEATGTAATATMALTEGTTYYIKSSSAQSLTITPQSFNYAPSVANNKYTQSKTFTLTFPNAKTDGTVQILDATKIKVNSAQASASITENVVTITLADNLAASTDYAISVDAEAIGYNAGNANTAINLTVKTPAVFDGTYFIATTDGKEFISRGGDSNTEAAIDKFGIAGKFTTDENNVTHIQLIDNDKNLFGGSSSIYTDKTEADLGENAARARWTVAAVAGGYSLYNPLWSKYIKAGTGAESGKAAATYADAAYAWTLVAPAAHATLMATYKDANAAAVATAAGLSATTVAALKTALEANYTSENVDLTNAYSSVAEKYQPAGYTEKIIEQEYSGLSNGIYKVSIFAFHRIKDNADTYACYQNNTDNPTSYLYANDQKIQLPSVMSEPSASAYTGGDNPNYSPASGKNYPNNTTNAGQAFDAGRYKVEVFAVVTDGTLKIGLTDPGKYTNATWQYKNWICYRDLKVTKYQPSKESVTVTAADYATYVSSLPLDYTSTAIKAYTAKADAGKVVLTQINKVPANTPVILYKEGGTTEDIPVATSTDTPAASDLVAGTSAAVATADGDYTNYILNNGSNGIGFYLANGQTVAANRAYLHVPNSEKGSESRMTIVFDDQATGIADLKAAAKGDAIYNLNGQRIEKATKGIYIIGGKKMMKK